VGVALSDLKGGTSQLLLCPSSGSAAAFAGSASSLSAGAVVAGAAAGPEGMTLAQAAAVQSHWMSMAVECDALPMAQARVADGGGL